MNTLKFQNPTFNNGNLNYTVRLGDKHAGLGIGETVLLAKPNGELLHMATIESVIKCQLWNIPAVVMDKEHDERCRTLAGLQKILSDVYSLDGLHKRSGGLAHLIVTCIGFTPHGREGR